MQENPLGTVALRIFGNNLIIHRNTLTTLFDLAFKSHDNRNTLYYDEVLKIDFTQPLNKEQADWATMIRDEMMNENTARTVFAGAIIGVHDTMLQRFSAGLGLDRGDALKVGPAIRGVPASHVLRVARNMVHHHEEWELEGGETHVKTTYPDTYDVLLRMSRGGGVMAVDAFDALVRLSEPDETYVTLEQNVYACATELVAQKWPD